jgi:hypothetical protein
MSYLSSLNPFAVWAAWRGGGSSDSTLAKDLGMSDANMWQTVIGGIVFMCLTIALLRKTKQKASEWIQWSTFAPVVLVIGLMYVEKRYPAFVERFVYQVIDVTLSLLHKVYSAVTRLFM